MFLSGIRRIGKTTFIKQDLVPALLDHGALVLYVDLWHERRFAQSIGYRFEITEPVQTAVRHLAPAYGLGYVLTRPFEWGRPLEEWA